MIANTKFKNFRDFLAEFCTGLKAFVLSSHLAGGGELLASERCAGDGIKNFGGRNRMRVTMVPRKANFFGFRAFQYEVRVAGEA